MAQNSFSIHQTSAFELLATLGDESIDCIITDPPYESLEKHRAVGTTTRLKKSDASSNVWFSVIPNSSFPELMQQMYRVLKKDRHFYLFCDQETMFAAKPAAEKAGFKFWKPLVWDKCAIGMGYHYRARYEFILFFEKGKRKLNNLSIPDILAHKRIHNGYPTQKPAPLIKVLIEQSTQSAEMILDPFMGSASTGEAALTQGRNFIGADIADYALQTSSKRLEALGHRVEQLEELGVLAPQLNLFS
jgi:site-specific DNA-methyltransferase (adenine-specific)